jgi:aspartokinase
MFCLSRRKDRWTVAPDLLADDVETTATYWEARIKTYGFHRVTDLCLFKVSLENFEVFRLGHPLCRMGEEGIPLVLTFAQGTSQGLSASFVVPHLFEGSVRERLQETVDPDGEGVALQVFPVEVIFFYGPHFGDRYGIAEAALQSLAGSGIHPTATACSGSCVYLVLPEGKSDEAVRVLSEAFDIPRASARKSPGVKQA